MLLSSPAQFEREVTSERIRDKELIPDDFASSNVRSASFE